MLLIDALDRYLATNTRIRSNDTREHYRRSVRQFGRHVGHNPTTSDLTDDNLASWMLATLAEGLTEHTANQRAKQIKALWNWLAKRRVVEEFPTVANLSTPEPLPEAWSVDEFRRLLQACQQMPGWIGPHLARDWWYALHCFLWDTGERIGAVLQLERTMVDLETAMAKVPARIRKGSTQSMVYRLRPTTVAVLTRMMQSPTETGLVWDRTWQDDQTTYHRYRKVIEAAGLPWVTRKTGFHKVRKTVLTQIAVCGGDPTAFAGHSSAKVTQSYIDRSMVLAAQRGVWPQELPASPPPAPKRWWHRIVG